MHQIFKDALKPFAPKDSEVHLITCEGCGCEAPDATDDGEGLCENCCQNRAEAAWERYCADFHDGGATQFRSLRDQQIEAQKLK